MKKLVAIFFVALLSSNVSYPQQSESRYQELLHPQIEKIVREQNIPGFAIGIVQNQKVVYSAAFGVANITEPQRQITTQSLFHMASVTKPFVATSIMQLVEQGKINLDAPVVRYLPYFRLRDKRYLKITVRQMLSHISGMPDTNDYGWDKPQFDDLALERYVRSLKGLTLDSPPGTKFAYSNIAYEVLGDVIAKVSGQSFEDYVQKHILEPLGMNKSTLLLKQTDAKLITTPHVLDGTGQINVSKIFPYNRMHSPSSTLYSNVDDMTRWAMANLNRGELDGQRILNKSSYDVMWLPNEKTGSRFGKVGISWFLDEHKNHKTVLHAGGDTGFNSFLILVPDRSVGIVMMTNYDGAYNVIQAIVNTSLDMALGLPPDPLFVKTSISRILYPIIAKDGVSAAIEQYHKLKQTQPDIYDFAEEQLNGLGYALIRGKKLDDALEILKLNAKIFPDSANVYDSLGEAYMLNGNRRLAIKNYEKSLKLDPSNSGAKRMLKKLGAGQLQKRR